jgi:putative DNA primase/helicase
MDREHPVSAEDRAAAEAAEREIRAERARGREEPPIGEEPARGNEADHGSDAAAGAGSSAGDGGQSLGDEPKAEFGEDMLATRFTELHGEDWRYVDAWGKWMLWTYSRWIVEGTRAALHLVRLVCRVAAKSAATANAAAKLASRSTVSGVEALARSDRRHAMTVDDWDRDPYLLNTLKGTVDLRTGELREHRREDYITKIAAATPQGECPRWKEFLDEVTARNLEYQGYLQRMTGYMLTGRHE